MKRYRVTLLRMCIKYELFFLRGDTRYGVLGDISKKRSPFETIFSQVNLTVCNYIYE